jgi:rod shape-determining protein MreD
MNRTPVKPVAGLPSSLSALEPIDAMPFHKPSSPGFVWTSLILVWLISLLPWRSWPSAPDLLLLVVVFWAMNERRVVGFTVAVIFGLLMDVHDATLLGGHVLTYALATYGALLLRRRTQLFGPVAQALHLLPVFVLSVMLSRLVQSWLMGAWPGWDWLWSALITTALWPLADILLHFPQRGEDGMSSGSA